MKENTPYNEIYVSPSILTIIVDCSNRILEGSGENGGTEETSFTPWSY